MENLILIVALIANLLVITVGLGVQIYKNYKAKSASHLSLILYIFSFCGWVSWAAYGFIKGDWFLMILQSLGALTTSIVLVQFFIYRKLK